MDGLGNEVTLKIRSAIKSKLSDLGAHVDDELPDYIMVMVANKKPKAQMIEDLKVFLGNKTVAFSNWLHDALEKMNLIASESTTGRVMVEDAEEILTLKDEPELDDPLSRELQDDAPLHPAKHSNQNKQFLLQPAFPSHTQEQATRIVPSVVSIKPILSTKVDPLPKMDAPTPIKTSHLDMKKEVKSTSSLSSFITEGKQKSEKQTQVKKHTPVSHVGAIVKRNVESFKDEDDTSNVSFGSVASIVKVTERKPSIHPNLQANSRLLLKAVEEANKSVQTKTPNKKLIPVGPCKPIYNQKQKLKIKPEHIEEEEMQIDEKEIAILEEEEDEMYEEEDTRTVVQGKNEEAAKILSPVQQVSVLKYIPSPTVRKCNQESDTFNSSPVLHNKTHISTEALPVSRKRKLQEDDISGPKRRENSPEPHFVVTLNGVDPNKFLKNKKARRSVVENNDGLTETLELEEELDLDLSSGDDKFLAEVEEVESADRASEEENEDPVKVRCKYWPACKNGTMCAFHHPNVPCTKFPHCKFGNKCLYIHPNCKYDSSCTRSDCPYTHSSKRGLSTPPPPSPSITKTYCRFFPKCFNAACPFYHPSKMCRFGFACQISHCPFTHPSFPSRQNLKWVSPARTELSDLPESDSCVQK